MPTIRDVARLAGVGVATASRALSGQGSVAAATVVKVRAAAEQLGYRPSSVARALTLRRTDAIGVYVPHFDSAFYATILRSVDAVLRAAGRHMVVANGCGAGPLRQQAQDGIDFLISRDCDGLLLASHSLTDADIDEVLQRMPRTVVVNRIVPGHEDRCLSVDHEEAGRVAARMLLSRGHRDIATIAGPADAPDNRARMHGFVDELARHGLAVHPAHQDAGLFEFDSGEAALCRLLPALRGQRPGVPRATAVFAANDLMAMAALASLVQSGVSVPDELSVLGYDDTVFARYTAPPLATVRVPIADLSADACRLLLNDCYGTDLPVQRQRAATAVPRGSLGPGPHPPLGPDPAPAAAA